MLTLVLSGILKAVTRRREQHIGFPTSGRQNQSWLVLDSEIPKCHVSNRWNTVAHNTTFTHKGNIHTGWKSRESALLSVSRQHEVMWGSSEMLLDKWNLTGQRAHSLASWLYSWSFGLDGSDERDSNVNDFWAFTSLRWELVMWGLKYCTLTAFYPLSLTSITLNDGFGWW